VVWEGKGDAGGIEGWEGELGWVSGARRTEFTVLFIA